MKAKGDAMSQHVAPCRESRVEKTVQEKGLQQEFPRESPLAWNFLSHMWPPNETKLNYNVHKLRSQS